MGVFEDLNRPQYSSELGMKTPASAPCKPDYEKIITTAKAKQDRTKTLISALQNYLLPELHYDKTAPFTIDSLLGRLFLEDLEYDLAIERLMEQQEAEDK